MSAVNAAVDWVKTRINNIDIFDEHHREEAKTNPWYSLGPIFYLVWFIVMFTGCVLIMWYVPTKSQAFDSILAIQTKIPFGGLMRGVHKYGADAMIIAATMRMYRMFICADYKPGKEFNIAIALVALLLSMYSGLTGYLLIWNQRAFWATKVFATFPTYMDQFPVMGDFYQPLVKSIHMGWNTAEVLLGGGAAITQETITRFFSIHLAFSLIPLIFVEIYFYKNAYKRVPLSWAKRTIITLMLVVVAIVLPAAQGKRSDPDVTPLPILSDWYFLGLYQMYKYLEPVVATEITIILPLIVVGLPFMDVWMTGAEKDINKRPFILWVVLMAVISWVVFSLLIIANIANIHTDPPYWRAFTYLTVNVGMGLQLWLMWQNKDAVQRAKQWKGALVIAIIGASQAFWAFAYYYMAKVEMFRGPMFQQWFYGVVRPFLPEPEKLEAAMRACQPTSTYFASTYKTDWQEWVRDNYVVKGGPEAQAALNTVLEHCKLTSPVDWMVTAIPTFTPEHPKYLGMVDYLVTNRWAYDYVVFCDRMNPLTKIETTTKGVYYPLPIPEWDLTWMIAGFVFMIVGFWMTWHFKSGAQPAPKPAPAQPASAAT
ncbi:MAG: cytochrome bc complex cytochrome b subunit [Candidatus Melainabacteria bacterium]|jgi:ubiquinol-cytochrome c reductase cytochrome b subunit/cytochrome b6|nr:cytochrome bc complex cytochrome b subunit [Candidatus Melainabacteria bacterium]